MTNYELRRHWHIVLNNIDKPHHKGYIAQNIKKIIKELHD